MAIMLNLAIFCIFGVLQVSCQQCSKCTETTAVSKELKASETIPGLLEIAKYIIGSLKGLIEVKTNAIAIYETQVAALCRCGCGKEIEIQKNKEEARECLKKILAIDLKLIEYCNKALPDLGKLLYAATLAMNSLRCNCKNYACCQKYDYPEKKPREVKECKEGKNNKRVRELIELSLGSGCICELSLRLELSQRIYQSVEYILKLKEELTKDPECKDEKILNEMREKVNTIIICVSRLISSMTRYNYEVSYSVRKCCEEGLKEITTCKKR